MYDVLYCRTSGNCLQSSASHWSRHHDQISCIYDLEAETLVAADRTFSCVTRVYCAVPRLVLCYPVFVDMPYRTTSKEDTVAVIALYKGDKTVKEIVELTGVKVRTVQRLIKSFVDNGEAFLPTPKPKPGRPALISPRTKVIINRQVNNNPRLTAREVKQNNPQLLDKVSTRTVSKCLHDDLGYRSYRARRKPLTTKKQKEKRLAFAKKYSEWSVEQWKSVLWSDEATFTVQGCGYDRVYRRKGSDALDTKFTTKTVKHPDSVMVWGCFGYHGVGDLVILPKNQKVNQYVYKEMLQEHLVTSMEKTQTSFFMQDGAPCHTARSVVNWLSENEIDYFSDWPGNSPDLNPIENIWGLMKRKLRAIPTPSVPTLIAEIQRLWDNYPADDLQHCALSLPRRLQEVKDRKGIPGDY